MKKMIIAILLFPLSAFALNVYAESPVFLTTIPVECEQVKEQLSKVQLPKGFKITVNEAHKRAIKASNIIKPCASKLEQAIYHDNKYYYFTNTVLFPAGAPFPEKFEKVDGITSEAVSNF